MALPPDARANNSPDIPQWKDRQEAQKALAGRFMQGVDKATPQFEVRDYSAKFFQIGVDWKHNKSSNALETFTALRGEIRQKGIESSALANTGKEIMKLLTTYRDAFPSVDDKTASTELAKALTEKVDEVRNAKPSQDGEVGQPTDIVTFEKDN